MATNRSGIPSARRWAHLPLATLFLVNVFYATDLYILNMLIEPIRLDLGLTDGQIGILTGIAFGVAYAVMTIPMGRLTDRANRVRIVAIAVTVWSLFTALFGAARNYTHMILLRIGVACGEAGGFIPAQSLVGDLYPPERRATALAVLLAGMSVGKMTAFAVAGILNEAIGWRMTFAIVGLAGVLMGPFVMLTVREPKRGAAEGLHLDEKQAATTTRQAVAQLLSQRAFPMILLGVTFASLGSWSMLTWLPTFFIRRFEMTTAEAGILISTITIAPNLVGMFLAGIVSDRLFRRDPRWALWIPALGLVVAGPALAIQVFAPSLEVAIVAGLLPGFVSGVYQPPLLSAMQTVAGARLRGTATAFITLALLLVGRGVGPALTGFLSDFFAEVDVSHSYVSLRNSLACISVFFVLGGLTLLAASRTFVAGIASARRFDESGTASAEALADAAANPLSERRV